MNKELEQSFYFTDSAEDPVGAVARKWSYWTVVVACDAGTVGLGKVPLYSQPTR